MSRPLRRGLCALLCLCLLSCPSFAAAFADGGRERPELEDVRVYVFFSSARAVRRCAVWWRNISMRFINTRKTAVSTFLPTAMRYNRRNCYGHS